MASTHQKTAIRCSSYSKTNKKLSGWVKPSRTEVDVTSSSDIQHKRCKRRCRHYQTRSRGAPKCAVVGSAPTVYGHSPRNDYKTYGHTSDDNHTSLKAPN